MKYASPQIIFFFFKTLICLLQGDGYLSFSLVCLIKRNFVHCSCFVLRDATKESGGGLCSVLLLGLVLAFFDINSP